MSAMEPVLTDSKTLNEVVNCLTEHIPIQTQGKCEQQNIFEILIRAATQKDSIENTTNNLAKILFWKIICDASLQKTPWFSRSSTVKKSMVKILLLFHSS